MIVYHFAAWVFWWAVLVLTVPLVPFGCEWCFYAVVGRAYHAHALGID
ncbi:MAG TPA: hypothetical protein VGE74_13090 [Gemmata sp.]